MASRSRRKPPAKKKRAGSTGGKRGAGAKAARRWPMARARTGTAGSGVAVAARELAGVRELVMLVQLQEGPKTYEEIKEDYERFTGDKVHHRAMYRIIKGLLG